jgi:hypothetical protein
VTPRRFGLKFGRERADLARSAVAAQLRARKPRAATRFSVAELWRYRPAATSASTADRRPLRDPRPLLPRRARPVPLLARACFQLLPPRRRWDKAPCLVRGTPASAPRAHHARRSSVPLAGSALRGGKHLRRPRTRARTARTASFFSTTKRHRAHGYLAGSRRCASASQALSNSDRRLHPETPVPAPARPWCYLAGNLKDASANVIEATTRICH